MHTAKKKSFLVATVCLILCVALLVGTTFAWFTDSVSNTGNRIQAGTLQIDLLKHNGTDYESIADGSGDIFSESGVKWEPGQTQFAFLAVENKGNLALKYNTYIDVTDGGLVGSLEYALVPGSKTDIGDLSGKTWDYIKALTGAVTGDVAAGRTTLTTGVLDEIAKGTENERDYVLLAVHMKEDAGNEYQNKNVIIDVTLAAAQMTAEEDGFGSDQYDKDATGDVIAEPIHATNSSANIAMTTSESTITEVGGVTAGETIEIKTNTESKTSAKVSTSAAGAAMTQILSDEENVDTSENREMVLNLSVDTTESANYSMTLDINVTADITYYSTADGTKHTITDEPVTSLNDFVTVETLIGKNLQNVVVTHDGNAMDAMSAATETPSEKGGYFYSSGTGILTIKSKSFSPYEVTYEEMEIDGYRETTDGTIIPLVKDVDYTVDANGRFAVKDSTNFADKVVLPSKQGIVSVSISGFSGNTALKEIVIPEGVTTLRALSFYECSKLEKITMPSTLTSIGYWAFVNCDKLNNVVIPEGVTEIAEGTFMSCDSLSTISIPSTCVTFKESAFEHDKAFTNYDWVPDTVTTIGQYACQDFTWVHVNVPKGISELSNYFFSENRQLEGIYIGKNITKFGTDSFRNCEKLSDIYYEGTEEEWNNITKVSGWNQGAKANPTMHYNVTESPFSD